MRVREREFEITQRTWPFGDRRSEGILEREEEDDCKKTERKKTRKKK